MRYGIGRAAALMLAPVLLGTGSALAAQGGDFAYVGASLFGENEVGHEGAGEDASGDFTAELDLKAGRICYLLEVDGLDEVVAAHVHEGGKGENGPPVMSLELVGPSGDDVCVAADAALLAKIAKKPAEYYVNVHTKAIPQGAVRGQLGE